MGRIHYRDYNPGAAGKEIIARADQVLCDYATQGYQLSLRQLFYQFVARDWLPNTMKSYNRLGEIVARARDAGMLDWNHLEDRGRQLKQNPHWIDPADFLESVCPQYRIDLWEDQPRRVEVFVEKEALIGVVARAVRDFDVPYFACKGYVSQSAMWEAGHNRYREYGKQGVDVVVLHLGDHDPSGIDMTRDIEERLQRYARLMPQDGEYARKVNIEVRRIALNMSQVEDYQPPPNPAKLSDSRSQDYIARFGEESWELDALDPGTISDLIQSNILDVMDNDLFQIRQQLQTEQRELLGNIPTHWDLIVEYFGLEDQ